MEYRIIRHAEGKEREDHKYIARVPVGVKRGKKIYRYFYDKPTYQAYLNKQKTEKQKNVTEDENTKGKKFLKDGQTAIEKLFNNVDEKNKTESSKLSDYTTKGEQSVNRVLAKHGTESVGSLATIAAKVLPIAIKAAKTALKVIGVILAKEIVKTLINNNSNKKRDKTEPEDETKPEDDNSKKKPMTFESEDDWQDYLERLKYQENEPDFMKHVKDIPEDEKFTKFEDQEKINETYDPYDDNTSRNCANCSAAYELRRRGYDVEAVDNGGEADYNGHILRAYDYFENATTIGIFGDGSTTTYNEEFMTKYAGSGVTRKEIRDNIDNYNLWAEDQNYTADTLEKGILDNNPPGSRGMIDVVWNGGGGHSIVYEVDLSGNVIIRDSQTYDEYSLDELAHNVSQVQITRTDNLELKEEILSAVRPNTDRERKYYVDQRTVYPYEKRKR